MPRSKKYQIADKSEMTTISQLPPEILIKIFQFYINIENQRNLLKNISCVCKKWKALCRNPVLWKKFDGTVSFAKLLQLCRTKLLAGTTELTVSETETISVKDAYKIFSRTSKVEVVNLTNVKKFSEHLFSVISMHCSKVKEVEVGNSRELRKLGFKLIEGLFRVTGTQLTSLKLYHCHLGNCSLCLRTIADYCRNLENLYLIGVEGLGVFSTKQFQHNCTKLKYLYLDFNIRISCDKLPCGFPELELFSYIDSDGKFGDKELECLLFNSPNLKYLNLTRCHVSPESICSLPACYVKYLYLSQSRVLNQYTLSDVLKKWASTLKVVDVSHSNNVTVNKAVWNLLSVPGDSHLEVLELSFTQVTASIVKKALGNCSRLNEIHLSGCRNLGRGMKKSYIGKSDFKALCESLEQFSRTNPEEYDMSE